MLQLIPNDAKHFYDFLKSTRSRVFVDNMEGFGELLDFEMEEIELNNNNEDNNE